MKKELRRTVNFVVDVLEESGINFSKIEFEELKLNNYEKSFIKFELRTESGHYEIYIKVSDDYVMIEITDYETEKNIAFENILHVSEISNFILSKI